MRYLVSVHDVMPETLVPVEQVVRLVERTGHMATLLVVPGREWSATALDTLRRMQASGHRLAGHGWSHRVEAIHGLKHRLHGRLLSRNAAEHLALPPERIIERIHRCYVWFPEHGFEPPDLYVPPAWALGLKRTQLAGLPFGRIETLLGFHDLASGRFETVPLVGFEADTATRALALAIQNRLQLRLGRARRLLRVAIHPRDLQLRLARHVEPILRRRTDGLEPTRGSLVVLQRS